MKDSAARSRPAASCSAPRGSTTPTSFGADKKVAGRRDHAQGGLDRLVGHLDDLVQGQAPELHVQVDELDHLPKANAQVAEYFGEAPAQTKACAQTADKNHCTTYHALDQAYADKIAYWTTPTKDCGDDRGDDCKDYAAWTQAWTRSRAERHQDGRPGTRAAAGRGSSACRAALHARPRLRLAGLLSVPLAVAARRLPRLAGASCSRPPSGASTVHRRAGQGLHPATTCHAR